jgi:syntaxin-binding protein 1
MDGVLGNLYTPKHTEKKEETIQAIASKLTTILTSLKDFYNVQILYSKGEKSAAKPIAESLQKNIDKLLAVKGSTTPVSKPAPVTFIVMDRTKDPMTPLKHDLYYNSLIMDLLDIRDSKYEFETINEKKQKSIKISNLNSSDKIWMDNRLSPYMKALTVIVQGFNSFLANNSAAKM